MRHQIMNDICLIVLIAKDDGVIIVSHHLVGYE